MDKRSSGVLYSAVSTQEEDVGNSFELGSRHNTQSVVSERELEVEVEAAVVVRNAEKWYKAGKPVITGLNMTVPSGSIYALLGSSGCGKTSILSCIVGLRKLNKGRVFVFGEKPGTNDVGVPGRNVGYMPQETSLYGEFTVWETLSYFGTFSGMTKEQVGAEFKFLVNLLDLPPLIRVGTLSGGQRRRVSFAAAMIHNPQLLILDEPTVGIDPLLRQQIWAYLAKLVTRRNTTVIITTHYIEEARQANMIGVMRNGKMIAEESPQNLITQFATEENGPLENAVLKLCKEDSLEENENGNGQAKQRRRRNSKRRVSTWDIELDTRKRLNVQSQEVKMPTVEKESDEKSFRRSWQRIKALTRKNIIILLRNYPLLLFVILIPSMEMVFMGIAFGYEPKHLKIGVVNQEVNYTNCSNYIPPLGKCELSHLSCSYLSHIDSDKVELEPFESQEYAENAVRLGKVWGYLIFPQNFSNDIYQSMVRSSKFDKELLNSRKILGKFDETNKHISGTIKISLYKALSDFTSSFLSKCGINPKRKQSSLHYKEPLYGNDVKDMSVYATPSMAVAALFFFPIISIGIRFIDERQSGVLERSLVAGVRTWEISAAYLISEFFVLLTQEVFVLGVLTFIAEIKIKGSVLLVLGLFLLIGYCGVSMGFLLGSVCTEKIEVAILALASLMPNVLLSGVFWPVQGMPEIVQHLVKLLPCNLSGESVRSIVSRGWGLTHFNVWPGFVSVLIHTVLYLLLTILLHKIKAKL